MVSASLWLRSSQRALSALGLPGTEASSGSWLQDQGLGHCRPRRPPRKCLVTQSLRSCVLRGLPRHTGGRVTGLGLGTLLQRTPDPECSSAFLPAPGLLGLTSASFHFHWPRVLSLSECTTQEGSDMAGFPVPTRAENGTRSAANARKLFTAVPSDHPHTRQHCHTPEPRAPPLQPLESTQ